MLSLLIQIPVDTPIFFSNKERATRGRQHLLGKLPEGEAFKSISLFPPYVGLLLQITTFIWVEIKGNIKGT